MIRGLLVILSFISTIFFPWPLTAVLTIAASFFIPFLPLAIGIFADTLYYSPTADSVVPIFTLYGALATAAALFVHRRLRTGII